MYASPSRSGATAENGATMEKGQQKNVSPSCFQWVAFSVSCLGKLSIPLFCFWYTVRGHNPHRLFGMVSDFFSTEITEKKGCYDGVRRSREKCPLWPCVVYPRWLGMVVLFVVFLLLPLGSVSGVGFFPTQPMLRLDGGMHTALVGRIGVDAGNRFAASVSLDKTLRLWSLPDGRLRRTFRVPLGEGDEGRLFAVAVSPDGHEVAATGWTGRSWDTHYSIHLFNVADGQIKRRIVGLPEPVRHLAYSKGGRVLAAVMANKGGLRVFRAQDGSSVARDPDYAASGNWIDFGPNGRMVTTSNDGTLRLYDSGFKLRALRKISSRYRPYAAEISPDGSKIAVGFLNRTRVAVFSAATLELDYYPDNLGVHKSLLAVAWSLDGKSLYAGGGHHDGGRKMIRWWSRQGRPDKTGRGEFVDLPVSYRNISQISSLRNGGILVASADPSLVMLDSQGFRVFTKGRPNADFRGLHKYFMVSKNGEKIQFSYRTKTRKIKTARFNAKTMRLTLNPSSTNGMSHPLVGSPNIRVTRWLGKSAFRANGRVVRLAKGEVVNGLAIARNERFFVVGTSNHLRLFNKAGRERWRIPVYSPIRAVNVSKNGRWIVAAFEDGTIRWYQVGMGKILLTLFVHNDSHQWVVWTPEKFYVASQGAEAMLGWYKNRGKGHSPEYMPAEKFHALYNKPGKIQRLFR